MIYLIVGLFVIMMLFGGVKGSPIGRIFLFTLVVLAVALIFGAFIPFREIVISVCMWVIIGCILYLAYNRIFS